MILADIEYLETINYHEVQSVFGGELVNINLNLSPVTQVSVPTAIAGSLGGQAVATAIGTNTTSITQDIVSL